MQTTQVARLCDLDYGDLERKLREAVENVGDGNLVGIISDTVFSIEGDAADVPVLCELNRKHKTALVLDAAHGLPAIGQEGESIAGFDEYIGKADAVTTSLGKYFAVGGGMVACSAKLRELLANRARGYIYSGSISPLALAALHGVLARIEGVAA